MKGSKLICSFWVAVGFVLFFLDSFHGVSTHVMYSNLPNEASYEVVDVSDMITVEYAIDGISHTCVVKPMLSSYQTGDKGVLRYEEIDNPILDKEADDSYRYFKVGLAITVVCALLLLCSTHGWI